MSTDTAAFTGNIAAHLPRMASEHADSLAVSVQQPGGTTGKHRYATYTLSELEDESNRIAHGLDRIGISRGVRTVLMGQAKPGILRPQIRPSSTGRSPRLCKPGMRSKFENLAERNQPEALSAFQGP